MSAFDSQLGRRTSIALAILFAGAIAACENPQPPMACGPLPQVTVNVGESTTVPACFNDPNGDVLTYTATSSNATVATASISGTSVTVAALAPGNATVTITAADPDGLQGQQSLQVMVPNRPPQPRGTIPALSVPVGETGTVNASQYFNEPDGEALTFSATSSNPAVVTVWVGGGAVTVTAVGKGASNVTITATDPGGLAATQTFSATVPNRGPETVGTIPDRTVEVGQSQTLDMAQYFEDPDGDALTYTATSSSSSVARASVSGSTVTITAVATGSATITVAARDPDGLTATQTVRVTVGTAGAPDLTVPTVTPTSASASPGDTVRMTFTIRNRGNAASTATTVHLLESRDATISTSDRVLFTGALRAVAGGESLRAGFFVTLGSQAGTYYFGICVDPVSGESDTRNNCSRGVRVTVRGGGGSAGFRDDFASTASLSNWRISNARANVANGRLELTRTSSSNAFGAAERVLGSPISSWTIEARMGRRQTTSSLVSVHWRTGHSQYTRFAFDIGGTSFNYALWAYDSNGSGWVRFTDVSGNSSAINDGAGELTTIHLSFAGGQLRVAAGTTELFKARVQAAVAAALAQVRSVVLVSEGAVGRTVVFDWIDVDGTAASAAFTDRETTDRPPIEASGLGRIKVHSSPDTIRALGMRRRDLR